jgi:hypothetical protein
MIRIMAFSVFMMSSLIPQAAASKAYWPLAGEFGALCFERAEENGALNGFPVTIVVGDYGARATLPEGRDAVCLYLPASAYQIKLEWLWDPRDPHPRSYTGPRRELNVVSRSTTMREICSDGGDQKTGNPHWIIASREECARIWSKSNTRGTTR